MRNILLLSLGLSCAVLVQAGELKPKKYGDFKSYTLALSWQPEFCFGKKDKNPPLECAYVPVEVANNLTVHGLWPSLPPSLLQGLSPEDAGKLKSAWFGQGCGVAQIGMPSYSPQGKCYAPGVSVGNDNLRELASHMPGANPPSCLANYEWGKHGVCFEFDQSDYFMTMTRFNRQLRASAFGKFLADNAGKTVKRSELQAVLNGAFNTDISRYSKLQCSGKGNEPRGFAEVQLSLQASTINKELNTASLAEFDAPDSAAAIDSLCPEQIIIRAPGAK